MLRPLEDEVAVFNPRTDSLHLMSPTLLAQLSQLAAQPWESQDKVVQHLHLQHDFEDLPISEVDNTLTELIRLELIIVDVSR